MVELISNETNKKLPRIKIIGVGGCGNNAVNRLVRQTSYPIEYIAVNTDQMVLDKSTADICVPIGKKITNGFGAGGDPEVAKSAAEESESSLMEIVKDAHMVILTAGMGGGTGTGATPYIAKLCKDAGILTVAIVTTPFCFENPNRMDTAKAGIHELENSVDTLLVISNDKLLNSSNKNITMSSAFTLADSVLKNAIDTVTNIIYNCGTVNLDFNDLKTVLSNKGYGHLGIGHADENKTLTDAIKEAVNSPLLCTNLQNAKYIMINSSGDVNLMEITAAIKYVQEIVGKNAKILWGTVSSDAEMNDTKNSTITIIATGIEQRDSPKISKIKTYENPPAHSFSTAKAKPHPILKPIPTVKQTELVIPEFLQSRNKG